jgi:hypothetical protein
MYSEQEDMRAVKILRDQVPGWPCKDGPGILGCTLAVSRCFDYQRCRAGQKGDHQIVGSACLYENHIAVSHYPSVVKRIIHGTALTGVALR